MGLNAYFAYQVVGFHGTGNVSYRLALTAVFIEGFIFIFLSLIGMRQWLVKMLPTSIKIASGCGIGMFLALIGLTYSAGIGAITGSTATPLDIAGCPPEYMDENGFCTSHKMTNPTVGITKSPSLRRDIAYNELDVDWNILRRHCNSLSHVIQSQECHYCWYRSCIHHFLAVGLQTTLLFCPILHSRNHSRSTSFTYFPYTGDGTSRFEFFKKVVTFHPINSTLNALEWNLSAAPAHFCLALFTFLYVDIIDCTATLYSMARFSGVVDKESGDFPRSTLAYCTDAFCISVGALFGCSPVTAFIESGAGIAEGGKTGLTAMTCGICFLITLFFAPIFASIPPWATGCTLILVSPVPSLLSHSAS